MLSLLASKNARSAEFESPAFGTGQPSLEAPDPTTLVGGNCWASIWNKNWEQYEAMVCEATTDCWSVLQASGDLPFAEPERSKERELTAD